VSREGGIEGGVVGEFATVILPLGREGGREGGRWYWEVEAVGAEGNVQVGDEGGREGEGEGRGGGFDRGLAENECRSLGA
jgi:hypothetical protein